MLNVKIEISLVKYLYTIYRNIQLNVTSIYKNIEYIDTFTVNFK